MSNSIDPWKHFQELKQAVEAEDAAARKSAETRLLGQATAMMGSVTAVQTTNNADKPVSQEEMALADTNPVRRRSTAAAGLPRRVSQTDTGATRVSGSAYRTAAAAGAIRRSTQQAGAGAPPRRVGAAGQAPARGARSNAELFTCLTRLALAGAVAAAILVVATLTFGLYQYYRVASQLPSIGDLRQKAAQFETTRIYDRNGDVLYEINDPAAGRRTYVPLSKISPYLVAATIATEDKAYYSHPGFDLTAIGRAFLQNYQGGEVQSGASTITQQLARALLFSAEERSEQSYRRKVREALLAAEITRRYTKDEILELYLNEIYYGNLAYGIEAAANTYFNTSADKLSFGQAAFLAGLPQTPSVYDIYTNPEAVYKRLEDVLTLTYQASQEQGCIFVSNSPQRVCIDPLMVIQANDEMRRTQFEKRELQMRFPHWVTYISSLLESQFDPQTIYKSGFQVYTTIDPAIQEAAQKVVKDQVASLAENRASGGALVAIRPASGEILAMVGSPDFYGESKDAQVNMAINPRQPGSSIKPLTYTAAFEKGWTPSTLIWDVPSEFSPSGLPTDPSPPYEPVNYDGRFHGPVRVRSALANSFNVPAVKALQFVGIYDDPNTPQQDGFINFARRLGITTLNRPDYGLSLTLGGGEVSLLELTSAFGTLANNGRRMPPVAITKIVDYNGNLVYEYKPPQGEQAVSPEHAYLISSILSDNEARAPMFGRNSVLRLPFEAAAKTGTTNDFRDNWTLGYTPDLAAGVWVGNPDYTPMVNTTGLTGAAPIWSEFMQFAAPQVAGGNPSPFTRPGGIFEEVVCAISGTRPSRWCPEQTREIFAANQPPPGEDQDLWRKPVVDKWTGLLASAACQDFLDDPLALAVDDEFGRKWVKRNPDGQEWAKEMGFDDPVHLAPDRECREDDPHPTLRIVSPRDGETITSSPLEIYVVASATGWFDKVRLEWGEGEDPDDWEVLDERRNQFTEAGLFYTWDVSEMPPGVVTLRLVMESTEDTEVETRLRLILQVPTPTPLPTPTPQPTWTPLPTDTPVPTSTPEPTPTVLIFPKATETTPQAP